MISRPLFSALLAACVSATAFAQSTLDRAILGATAPLTAAQKSTLDTFLSKRVDAL